MLLSATLPLCLLTSATASTASPPVTKASRRTQRRRRTRAHLTGVGGHHVGSSATAAWNGRERWWAPRWAFGYGCVEYPWVRSWSRHGPCRHWRLPLVGSLFSAGSRDWVGLGCAAPGTVRGRSPVPGVLGAAAVTPGHWLLRRPVPPVRLAPILVNPLQGYGLYPVHEPVGCRGRDIAGLGTQQYPWGCPLH